MAVNRTISLQGTVNPGAVLTLASKVIQTPFAVRSAQVEFALGQNGMLSTEIAIDNDPSTPTSTLTNIGDNILSQYSRTAYLRGNNAVRLFQIDFPTPQVPAWIKVRAENRDLGAQHSVNVLVTIQLLTPDEYEAERIS